MKAQTKIRHIGNNAEGVAAPIGCREIKYKQGDTIEVPAEQAASFCESGNWEIADKPKPKAVVERKPKATTDEE